MNKGKRKESERKKEDEGRKEGRKEMNEGRIGSTVRNSRIEKTSQGRNISTARIR